MDEASLRSIALFESLSARERREIARHADEIDLPEGTELVRQGEFAYEFFVIEEGSADALRNGERVAELGPGDFLGEMGIMSGSARNATVVATLPIRAIVMTSRDFRSMARNVPAVAERITVAVEERSRQLVG